MQYQLVRLLRRGSLAEVHEARAIGGGGFARRVALKRPLAALASDPVVIALFAREAQLLSHLHHSNVLGALDFGALDAAPFIALELVEGDSLAALDGRARELGAPIPPAVALHVCAEVAHGLAHAHAARDAAGRPLGIVHRDVNPNNILLSWEGDVKVADFGVALAAGQERTAAGKARGTLTYMAPEQLRADEVDGRTDVYALGCVLHRLIAGRSPLDDEEQRRRVQAGQRFPIDPRIPEPLRPLLLRATEHDRPRRRGAADFAAEAGALCAALGGRDPRSELMAWLQPLRPRGATPPVKGAAAELLHFGGAPSWAEAPPLEPATAANLMEDGATTQLEQADLTPTRPPESFQTSTLDLRTAPAGGVGFATVSTDGGSLQTPTAAPGRALSAWPAGLDRGRFVLGLLLVTITTAWVVREVSSLAWRSGSGLAPMTAAPAPDPGPPPSPAAMPLAPVVKALPPSSGSAEVIAARCPGDDCTEAGAAPTPAAPRRPRTQPPAPSEATAPAPGPCLAPEAATARLQAAMNRARGAITSAPRARALETRYFELRGRAREATGESCAALEHEVADFERAVDQALPAGRP